MGRPGEGKGSCGRGLEGDGRRGIWAGAEVSMGMDGGRVVRMYVCSACVCVKAPLVARGGETKSASPWDRKTLELRAILRSRPSLSPNSPSPPKDEKFHTSPLGPRALV